MTLISLSKAYAIIDGERGKLLKRRKFLAGLIAEAGANFYNADVAEYGRSDEICKRQLQLLNKLKRELALVSDAEQLPLGL